MTTEQIYGLVNTVNAEAFGHSALVVTDTSSLISLGNTVLSSSTNTEAFLSTLAQRIGRTILRFREYRNKLGDMVLNDFEYGAILQKIKVNMPEAEADESYDLIDGNTVDHYKIAKPSVDQKLFVTRTPYQFHITIQRVHLKEAFLSAENMGSFIGIIFGEVRNAIEISLENLGRVTLATAIAEYKSAREIPLVTDFNTEYNPGTPLTAATAIHNEEFLRYAIMRMNNLVDMMQDASELYNDGSMVTFTPRQDVRMKVISEFQRRMETNVQYAAFHDQFVEIPDGYQTINFWQAAKTPYEVNITRPSDSTATTVNNVVAMLYDRDAMGVYKIDEEIATSPINAAGLYYNQYWHEKQLRFIDLSENGVIFTLN
ncbi:MAG: hypothetical protein VZR54_09305 [Ruminococcus sp.]|nr:hypothetical protein [Ruminococcus sp.]